MALTSNNIEMIKAIVKNDLHSARTAALASLAEDKSKKNAWAVDRYRKELTAHASVIASNMPAGLKTFLAGETPDNFHPEQYYARENEMSVYESIRRMKLTADLLNSKGIAYRNTTLLYGKTGTGKTELVPCVLMLDEVDCISMKRASGGSRGADGELERTTISLMQELDKLPGHVVLIAATNRPDLIDDALMRRFSIKCELLPMTRDELTSMVKRFLSATDTEKYIQEEQIAELTGRYDAPGGLMPELVRMIGDGIYEENKDRLEKETEDKEEEKIDLWQVTYTWQANISAETEADAIAIARNKRNSYSYMKDHKEGYSAKRAEYIYPENR